MTHDPARLWAALALLLLAVAILAGVAADAWLRKQARKRRR